MNCERCGWEGGEPHPSDKCPFDFRVNDRVYLATHPDRAPVLGKFLRISRLVPFVMALVETSEGEQDVSYVLLTHVEKWPVLV